MTVSKEELLEAKRQIESTLHKLRQTVQTLEGKETPSCKFRPTSHTCTDF